LIEKEILEYAGKKQMMLQGKALEALAKSIDYKKILDSLEIENAFMVTEEIVSQKNALLKEAPKSKVKQRVAVTGTAKGFKPRAKDMEPNFRIMKELDVTGQSCSEGKVSDFMHLFRSKFEALSGMLKNRHHLAPKPIKRLNGVAKNEKVDVVGMVYEQWTSKNGHLAFRIEDLEDKCVVLVMKNDPKLTEIAAHIMLDDVIGVKGVKFGDQFLIAKEILWPDLPMRPAKTSERKVSLASISDLHVGSKLFLEKDFYRFLDWINGRIGSEKEKEKVGNIKYLLVVGDNVDGIGIYPKQFDELNIRDINKQYDKFTKMMMEIPDYIEVIICPGQHDAVRWADPKPAIPKEFVKELSDRENFHFIGSPGWVEIEGLKTLLYHGDSLHDLISKMSFLKSSKPEDATVELLKKRDLMSAYGLRHPYVPEKKDFMIVREEPDLVFLGDMHHSGFANYRGTTVIHNGTWQAQTDYQVKLGHTPTPGLVPIIDLHTRKINQTRFIGNEADV